MSAQERDFAHLLRRYRLAAGLSQEELAERAELSARAVSDLERGLKTRPYRHTVEQLATALGLSAEDRLTLEASVSRKRRVRAGPVTAQSPAVAGEKQVRAPRRGLPLPLTPILGREREEARLLRLLRQEDRRLITLTGPGGVGKTRLALEVARRVEGELAGGAVFVSLGAVTDPALVPASIASAFGILVSSPTSPEESLLGALADRTLLLVLDNFEQVLPAGLFVSRLLANSPGLHLLVTSRAPLRLRGEQEIDIGPLALPRKEYLPSPEEVSGFPAVALFLQRARSVQPRFALTKENSAIVIEICRRLDGLPLALELAAARIRLLPPPALLNRLSSRLDLLTGGAADAPARQQSLGNTIAWSHNLLDDAEKTLFARLSVFVGGCTLEAADAVCNVEADSATAMLNRFASLVEKSLLREGGEDEPRFVMLETIREYAQERLQHMGAFQELKRRHGLYYLALAEAIATDATGEEQAAWLDQMEVERDNLRAALQWTRDSGSVELGLRLTVALGLFWERHGPLNEGQRWLEELLAAGKEVPPAVRAAALLTAGRIASSQQRSEEATELYEQSLAMYRAIGDESGRAKAITSLAFERLHCGDLKRAESLLEEIVSVSRTLGDEALLATSLGHLAALAAGRGDVARTRDLEDQSLALYRERADPLHGPLGLSPVEESVLPTRITSIKPLPTPGALWGDYAVGLAFAARSRGDYNRAIRLLQGVLDRALAVGDRRTAAYQRASLGLMAREQGHYERATALYQESLAVLQEMEDVWGTASAMLGLSDVARDRGNAEQAIERADHALGLFRRLGDRLFIGYSLHNLGLAAHYQGDVERAEGLFAECLTLLRELGGEAPVAEVLSSLGLLALDRGDIRRAEKALTESLRIARKGGMHWVLGSLLEGMAGIASERGHGERAARLFGAAEALRAAIGTPRSPANLSLYNRNVAAARDTTDDERFVAAWQAGRDMSREEAISCALGEDEQSVTPDTDCLSDRR